VTNVVETGSTLTAASAQTGDSSAKKRAKADLENAKCLETIRVKYNRETGRVSVNFAKARSANKGKHKKFGRKGRSRKKGGGKHHHCSGHGHGHGHDHGHHGHCTE
jgi:hypothetical protein